MGGVISNGTVTFYINDTLSKHSIGDIVYKPLTKVTEHEYLLPLDGQTIDGTAYKRLVDYLGTNVLPNLNGRYLRADTTPGTMVEAGLPNITGMAHALVGLNARLAWDTKDTTSGLTGPFFATGQYGAYASGVTTNGETLKHNLNFDASRSNSIYGKSTTVTPLTYTVRAYICYA